MNPTARRAQILNIIREQDHVAVDDLAELLQVSRETIRRDLAELARVGKVQKFHGGASLPVITGEGAFSERMSENAAAKVRIATEAVKLFSPGETLMIDTGSTTLYFSEKLAELSNITVVTNSAEIARETSLAQNRTFLLGGEFSGDNRQTIGSMTIAQVRTFRAHHAVLTIGALDARTGIMDFNIEEAQVARAMIEQAESLTILADSSKLDRIASFEVCGLDRVTNLVCDQMPSEKIQEALSEANVNLITVD